MEYVLLHGRCSPKNKQKIRRIVKKLQEDTLNEVVVLWAQRPHAMAFLKQSSVDKLYGKIWIGTEGLGYHFPILELNPKVVLGMLTIAPFSGRYENFVNYFANISDSTHGPDSWMSHYFSLRRRIDPYEKFERINDIIEEFPLSTVGYVRHAVSSHLRRSFNFSEYLSYVQSVKYRRSDNQTPLVEFDEKGDIDAAEYEVLIIQPHGNKLRFKLFGRWNNNASLSAVYPGNWIWPGGISGAPVSTCSEICVAGFYNISGSCCWKCVRCKHGSYKHEPGNHPCISCPFATISDTNRTRCISLPMYILKADSFYFILTAALSCIGIIFVMVTKTPLVKSSNFRMSLVQLFSHLCLFAWPAFFIGQPTSATCIFRHAFLGFFLTTIVSVSFIKTEYLLRVFGAVAVMSRAKVMISKTLEVSSLLIICISQIIFTVILNIVHPSVVMRKVLTDRVVLSCDNYLGLCVFFLFFFLILSFTLVLHSLQLIYSNYKNNI